jgi:hypothetical protein
MWLQANDEIWLNFSKVLTGLGDSAPGINNATAKGRKII